jgi:hypothetical protein
MNRMIPSSDQRDRSIWKREATRARTKLEVKVEGGAAVNNTEHCVIDRWRIGSAIEGAVARGIRCEKKMGGSCSAHFNRIRLKPTRALEQGKLFADGQRVCGQLPELLLWNR